VKNIDFLPEIYRQRRVLRHARLWWVGVAMLFSVSIGGVASTQWFFLRGLRIQLQRVEPQFLLAQEQKAEMARVEAAVKQAEELAALYLYLEHPWPRTQLLAAVAAPLPRSIQLIELHVVEESAAASGEQPAGPDANTRGTTGGKESPSAKTDLEGLRGVHDRQTTILELSGRASNIKELHDYVDLLAKSPLVAAANLKGLESGGEGNTPGASKFHLRIAIRPGHGQPGGPLAKGASEGVVAVSTVGGTP
jgi:hypothetical protein